MHTPIQRNLSQTGVKHPLRDSWIHTNAVMSSSSRAYTQTGSPMCIQQAQTLSG